MKKETVSFVIALPLGMRLGCGGLIGVTSELCLERVSLWLTVPNVA